MLDKQLQAIASSESMEEARCRLQVDLGSFTLHNRLEWVNGKGKEDPEVGIWVALCRSGLAARVTRRCAARIW